MIAEQQAIDCEDVYTRFTKTFGFKGNFNDIPLLEDGDIINYDAPSVVKDGVLVRMKNQYEVKEVTVTMIIPDCEASKSMDDLDEFYFAPSAKWLQEHVGNRVLVSQPNAHVENGQSTMNIRGLRMVKEYNAVLGETKIVFRVLAIGLHTDRI